MTIIVYNKEKDQKFGAMYSDSLILIQHNTSAPVQMSFHNKLIVDKSNHFCYATTGVIPAGNHREWLFNHIRSGLMSHYSKGGDSLPWFPVSKEISGSPYVQDSILMTRDKVFCWGTKEGYELMSDEFIPTVGSGAATYLTLRTIGKDHIDAMEITLGVDSRCGGEIHEVKQDSLKPIRFAKPKKQTGA